VNGDGRPDLLVANSGTTGVGSIGVLLNTSISFGLVPNPATVSISGPGQSGSATITVNANGSLDPHSLTNWSCSGLPRGSSCSFATIDPNNQVKMTIMTTANAQLHWPPLEHHQSLSYASLFLGLFGAVSITGRRRKRNLRMPTFFAVLGMVTLWLACGGSGSTGTGGGGGGGGGGTGTPAGSYNVTISATSGARKPSTMIVLNVQ